MMPKHYRFYILFENEKNAAIPTIVARNQDNAVKAILRGCPKYYPGSRIKLIGVLEESWLMQFVILLLPVISYRSSKPWRWVKP